MPSHGFVAVDGIPFGFILLHMRTAISLCVSPTSTQGFCLCGAAPMSMPATMAQAGWLWGTAMMVYSALISYHTALLLGHVCYVHPHLDTFPKVTAAAAEKLIRRVIPATAASGGARCAGRDTPDTDGPGVSFVEGANLYRFVTLRRQFLCTAQGVCCLESGSQSADGLSFTFPEQLDTWLLCTITM